jgi:hypothetical protein
MNTPRGQPEEKIQPSSVMVRPEGTTAVGQQNAAPNHSLGYCAAILFVSQIRSCQDLKSLPLHLLENSSFVQAYLLTKPALDQRSSPPVSRKLSALSS